LVRAQAATALGQVGDPEAVEPLLQGLHDPETLVQIAAAEALGTLRDARAVAALQAVFEHGTTYVPTAQEARICLQAKAARGLALIGEPASVELLERNLHSKRWGRQVAAAIGLAYRRDARSYAILVRALDVAITDVQIEVVQALGYLANVQAIQTLHRIAQQQRIPSSVTESARQILKGIDQGQTSGVE
jgi:HEAT repeat protein